MHNSSFAKMAAFLRSYGDAFPAAGGKSRILEIGSKSYEGQTSYRTLIDDARQTYTGLDLEAGLNVDIVPSGAYIWPEIADESFDVCISGQTFEHNPFFWVTTCEMARVLVPGGMVCVIAPGGGSVHRYPMDCWRFYPDAWAALCALAGLELVETYFEGDAIAAEVSGGQWRDSMMIARKPLVSPAEVIERRACLTAPFRQGFGAFEPATEKTGPAVADYLATVERQPSRDGLRQLLRKPSPPKVVSIYEPPRG